MEIAFKGRSRKACLKDQNLAINFLMERSIKVISISIPSLENVRLPTLQILQFKSTGEKSMKGSLMGSGSCSTGME